MANNFKIIKRKVVFDRFPTKKEIYVVAEIKPSKFSNDIEEAKIYCDAFPDRKEYDLPPKLRVKSIIKVYYSSKRPYDI